MNLGSRSPSAQSEMLFDSMVPFLPMPLLVFLLTCILTGFLAADWVKASGSEVWLSNQAGSSQGTAAGSQVRLSSQAGSSVKAQQQVKEIDICIQVCLCES